MKPLAMFHPRLLLTDAQVQAGARPGESWAEARHRLENASATYVYTDEDYIDADPLFLGADSYDCLDIFGQPIVWLRGELGYVDFG